VPEYDSRINAILFISHKDESYCEIELKLKELTSGFSSLRHNVRFHKILEIALAVGNYLNGSSFKGGAWGFKLDSIERLE
jgi:hypothetical protein